MLLKPRKKIDPIEVRDLAGLASHLPSLPAIEAEEDDPGGNKIFRKVGHRDGVRHSSFRLEPGPTQTMSAKPSTPAVERVAESLPLFTEGGR